MGRVSIRKREKQRKLHFFVFDRFYNPWLLYGGLGYGYGLGYGFGGFGYGGYGYGLGLGGWWGR